ncbi:MAG: UDP-N-acetylmuramate--L-alanine ligase [Eubacteriaceae bacterium]|nr:UDP-N-acetylmuramate--L-alanine ligase [Eubacteriaceae bacterium]
MQISSLEQIKKIYMIGIGGTSMSGLAMMSAVNGLEVAGSDMRANMYTDKLEKAGIKVYIGHDKNNVPADADLVVYSAAININTNVEAIAAKEYNIQLMERSYFLGLLTRYYPKTIAVSGTHGKTTTTSLVSLMLLDAGEDPSISLGGTIPKINANSLVGNSEYFVIEACEFIDSFLHTEHYIGIILNIEEDHLDYFTDGIDQIVESFTNFAKIIPKEGHLIANGDDPNVAKVLPHIDTTIHTFGLGESNDWRAANIIYDSLGKPTFDVFHKGSLYASFSLKIPGEHNVMDALSVIACGSILGISIESLQKTFQEFDGAKRRFEFKGEERGIKVFEDYAHHPTELRVTIQACLNYDHNKLWVVFQPHTYSRTFLLFDGFVDAVASAGEVIFNDIYSDREANDWNIYSEDLAVKVVEKHAVPASVISSFEDIVAYIIERAAPGDLVLVAGSQSINQVASDLVDALKMHTA